MNNALSLHYTMQFKQNAISTISFNIQHTLSLLSFLLLLLHTHNYTMLTI